MKRRLKQRLTRMMSVVLAFALIMPLMVGLTGQQTVYAAPGNDSLLIHQVFGGGGKSDTPFTHNFIELYNPSSEEVDLTGWRVDYSSTRGGSHLGNTNGQWVSLDLSGTVPGYSSYLIRGAAETTNLQVYSIGQFDQEWSGRYIDNSQYSLRLSNGDTIMDQVVVSEPALEGEAIASISKQQSVRRIEFKDTDNNLADFENLRFQASQFNSETALAAFIDQYRPRSIADGAWGLAPVGGEEPGEDDTVIKVFHINDVHSRANYATSPPANHPQVGYAQFKTFIDMESESADGKLVLDAGDTFHGQSFASIERGQGIAELLKAVGFDALSPGNHDFNYGVDRLKQLETMSGVPLLSANTKKDGNPLFDTNTLIKEIDGVKIGLFGLTTPETAYKTNPNNVIGVDFGTDEQVVEAAQEAVAELETAGADVIIALTHLGDDETSTIKSTDIAAQVEGINLIVDGHSHSNYPTGTKVNGVTIASTGEYFKNVGMVTIGYNKEAGEVTAVNAVSKVAADLALAEYPQDEAVKAEYEAIIKRQSAILDVIVGNSPIALDGARNNVRSGETNLGRLITDAMIAETGADIAITNGGGIRESIAAGDITNGDIINVLPFGNFIITKSLTGAQIKEAIEQGMAFGAGSFPHFGGMQVTVEKVASMAGSTPIEKGRVIDIQIGGESIDMNESYVVATNDFMGAGGDGYTVLQAPALINEFNSLDEALIKHIRELTTEEFSTIDAERRLIIAEKQGGLSHLGSYSTGMSSDDGGIAEIVAFNPDNRKMYLVNGATQSIDIVSLSDLQNKSTNDMKLDKRIEMKEMDVLLEDFALADITSIDINTEHKLIAASVQEADYTKSGAVLFLDYDGNLVKYIRVGVQPDMVTFTPDGRYVLTADEGEPRKGYGEGIVDPKGSVSIIDLSSGLEQATVKIVTFDAFDSETKRAELVASQVILKKGAAPSVDLEPEYVAVTSNSKTAYISLQEANAIATLDIEKGEFTSVKGLGFKDHSQPGNELDLFRGNTIDIKNHPVYGVHMPDGLAVAEIAGKTYILTPNEGDAREWGNYTNLRTATIDGNNFDALISDAHDGLDPNKTYILGGRSFSIFDAETMELVFDSGSDFEKITADLFPNHFNASNSNVTLKNRSSKKGPEPEDVKVIEVDGKFYAAVGLERIGGVMMYDITNPTDAKFYDYINTRDFSAAVRGDVSPEGLKFIKPEHSPTGYPLLLAAHEVSGTVAVYQLNEGYIEPQPMLPFELTVNKQTANGMATYSYAIEAVQAAPTYRDDYYIIFQVYEGANGTTPSSTIIKKVTAGASIQDEAIRIGSTKKVKIMVISDVDGPNGLVLAQAYGAE